MRLTMHEIYVKEVPDDEPNADGEWRRVIQPGVSQSYKNAPHREGFHVVQTASVDGYISILEAEIKALKEKRA